MTNEIVFYDLSLASDHDPRKIFSPNAWYVHATASVGLLERC